MAISKCFFHNIGRFLIKGFVLLIVLSSLNQSAWSSSKDHFITTWKTDNRGSSNATSITIPTIGDGYSYDVDWNNDGKFDEKGVTGSVTHDFGKIGIYTIRIKGDFPRIYFNNKGDKEKILSIDQWGTIQWDYMANAFEGASNLEIQAEDAPDLSGVINMIQMFRGTAALKKLGKGKWDVSNITDMTGMFDSATSFNGGGGIRKWNTGNVIKMTGMFYAASTFNQPIGRWNTSKVVDMSYMFNKAISFNQNIGRWDTANVTNMKSMFCEAIHFNQPLSRWNTHKVNDLSNLFDKAFSFNQPVGRWDVRSFTQAKAMFKDCYLSVKNYDDLLKGWSKQNLRTGVVFDVGSNKYKKGAEARKKMIDQAHWTITDGGLASDLGSAAKYKTSYMLQGKKIKDKYLWMENNQSVTLKKWVGIQSCESRQRLNALREKNGFVSSLDVLRGLKKARR